jgi:Mg2+/Co2+ transporter CorC
VSDNTRQSYDQFRAQLSKLLGREIKMPTVLRYLLAFLNSSYAQELLTTGHRPRPGDVFQVSDQLLEELSVPVCKTRRELQHLLDAVDACTMARTPDALETAESRLNNLVSFLYSKG